MDKLEGSTDGWTDRWINRFGLIDLWMDEEMDSWMDACIGGMERRVDKVDGQLYEWREFGWMDGWIIRFIDGWINGWLCGRMCKWMNDG